MKKHNTNFKFVIGNLDDNDSKLRLMQMDGNNVVQNIYKIDTKNTLSGLSECLRALANFANKVADEYENAASVKGK